jgi:hypothetical protein
MRSWILAAVLLGLSGCSVATKKETLTPEMSLKELDNPITQIQRSEPAIQIVDVKADTFHIEEQIIPDKEIIKRAKIMGAKLSDVIALLTEATNENIVFQLQAESANSNRYNTASTTNGSVNNNYAGKNDYLLSETLINLSSSNIPFGKMLQKTVGDKLSIVYDDDTFYLGNLRTVTLKIPSINGLPAILSSSIASMGATNVTTDAITSSVSFSAREKEYGDIMKYLEILRNNLYVIEYEISIYDVELKDNYALGIDWSLVPSLAKDGLSFVASAGAGLGSAGTSAVPLTFGMIMKNETYNGKALVNALENFGKVESVQRPKLLGLAGTTVKLTDGIEAPYISGIQNTSVGNGRHKFLPPAQRRSAVWRSTSNRTCSMEPSSPISVSKSTTSSAIPASRSTETNSLSPKRSPKRSTTRCGFSRGFRSSFPVFSATKATKGGAVFRGWERAVRALSEGHVMLPIPKAKWSSS